jgi:hypothetical protein
LATLRQGFLHDVTVFLDDIFVYSEDEESHEQHLHQTLALLRDNQLYAEKSRCGIGVREVEYLGHIVSNEGIHPMSKT